MDRTRIFPAKEENLNLIFPLFFIAAAIAEIFYLRRFLDQQLKNTWMFIALFLFLNYLHVFFTPYFLTLLPEGRKWFIEKCKQDKSHWWILGIFLLALYRFFFFKEEHFSPLAGGIFLGLLTLFANYHNASQTFGLSLLYNKMSVEKNSKVFSQIKKTEKLERIFFYIQFTLLSFSFALKQTPIHRSINAVIFPVAILLCFIYLFMVFKQTEGLKSNKFFYCLRFLLYPLSMKSFFAMIGFLSFHGIEYLLVTRKIVNAEQKNHKTGKRIFALILVIIFVVGGFSTEVTRNFFLSFWQRAPLKTMLFLNSFFSIFIFLHYWIDGLMFKSKDPLSKKYILNALVKNPEEV